MKVNTARLELETYYHIYNRSINSENIFKKEEHYTLFLKKYAFHVSPFVETYAYCLLGNHFHLLLKIKSQQEIHLEAQKQYPHKEISDYSRFISSQFSHFFNGYTQSINKQMNRTGGLFETPFRRIVVDSDAYFSHLVWYIHHNPQKHGLIKDFRDYPHSSFNAITSTETTKLNTKEVLDWFGGKKSFLDFHANNTTHTKEIEKLLIE